jgi:hypothetical protein
MPKNILSLTYNKALDFFLKSEQYHGFELPEYFEFDKVLKFVRDSIGDKPYDECLSNSSPENLDDVNMDILLNKDGHYAVRPLILANPFLYYFLVREICGKSEWKAIKTCFKAYTVPHITSCALPVIPEKQESFHKSATILNWWNSMEQRSLELSLDYRYMFVTDITNCYGSINPQSIEWALSCRNTKFETDNNIVLAHNIQKYLKALQQGHNIGIPQGSALFDFVGEIVLGYSDLLLHEELQRKRITNYEIIRYRDDYRVFCNDKDTLEQISYILQGVLKRLNFRLNSQKTKISDSIVTDSIKPDKLFYIYNTPIFNKKECDFDGIQKHLLYILMFAHKYPNSGQIRTMLSDLDKRIIRKLQPRKVIGKVMTVNLDDESEIDPQFTEEEYEIPGKIAENIRTITAVATQIALENVSVSHYALRVISRVVDSLEDMNEKQLIIGKVYNKLCNQPNSDYNQLWLQNMTYTRDKVAKNECPYSVRLCKLVMGERVDLWNNSWLKDDLVKSMPVSSIVNSETLGKVTPVITFRETRAYYDVINEENNDEHNIP